LESFTEDWSYFRVVASIWAFGSWIFSHPICDAYFTEQPATRIALPRLHNNFTTNDALEGVELQVGEPISIISRMCHFVGCWVC